MDASPELEGRWTLASVSRDGSKWRFWNDWVGGLPLYVGNKHGVEVAATLEPVVVRILGFEAADLCRRGLVELLTHGHCLGTDTLFRGMSTLAPDSVMTWKQGEGPQTQWRRTVLPSDAGWGATLEQLERDGIEETRRALGSALSQRDHWSIPLSGGMDSRLIACMASELKMRAEALTYGPYRSPDVANARHLARVLGIPWRHVKLDIASDEAHMRAWLELFGTAMHAHGMYQLAFVHNLGTSAGSLPDGFMGNNLAGGEHPSDGLLREDLGGWDAFYSGYGIHWPLGELRSLLAFDPSLELEEMRDLLKAQLARTTGWAHYQRRNWLDVWNRQARFISYQPLLYDLFRGGVSPFLDRGLARFWLGAPPALLHRRGLQLKVLRRGWPRAARVPCSVDGSPPAQTTLWMAKAVYSAFATKAHLPQFAEFRWNAKFLDELSLARGRRAVYVRGFPRELEGVLRSDVIEETIRAAIGGSSQHLARIRALNPLLDYFSRSRDREARASASGQSGPLGSGGRLR